MLRTEKRFLKPYKKIILIGFDLKFNIPSLSGACRLAVDFAPALDEERNVPPGLPQKGIDFRCDVLSSGSVQMFVSQLPKLAVRHLLLPTKGRSSREVQREFLEPKERYWDHRLQPVDGLVRISVGVGLMPGPGGCDRLFDIGVFRRPA